MSRSDQWVNMILVASIIIYLATWIFGYRTNKLPYLTSILNGVTGASVILYWAIGQMQIEQHIFEMREILVLLFEVVVIACAIFYIISSQRSNALKIMQYVFYGLHFTVLILGLIFMLTFKMNRLM